MPVAQKREASGVCIHIQAHSQRGLHGALAIGQRERELRAALVSALLHVVAADRDRVEHFGMWRAVYSMMSPMIFIDGSGG